MLEEPDVPPAAPLVLLPEPEAEPSLLPAVSLAPLEELELGELGDDELPDVELGLDGVVLLEDEDELGELGVVALPVAEPGRLLMSLELDPEDEDEEPGVAPELPLVASPGRSQP